MRRLLLASFALAAGLLSVTPAHADWTGKDAAGATITFKNPNACASVVCTPIAAIADPTGANLAAVPTAGADAQSNTANGLLSYNRNLVFNGTTWDRWQGAVTITGTLPAFASTPTFNLGTLNGAALATNQPTNAAQGSATSGQTGNLVQCAVTTAAPSYTTAQTDPFSCDPSGNLRVVANGYAIGSTSSGQQGSLVMATATTYAPTTTTADTWPLSMDTVGNLRTVPQASGSKVSGTASQASTTSTSLIGAVTSERIYAQNVSCSNTGVSASLVAFQDGSGGTTLWSMLVPAGAGNNMPGGGGAPLFWTTAGNALFFAPGTASTTVTCNASGYAGN